MTRRLTKARAARPGGFGWMRPLAMIKRKDPSYCAPHLLWALAARPGLEILKDGARAFHWRRFNRFSKRLRGILPAVLLAAMISRAQAAFDRPPIGAESAAMSGASLGRRGDSAALFLNAAGVAGLESREGYFMYNRLYAGLSGVETLDKGFAAFGFPTKLGSLAVGYGHFQASGLLEERVIGVTFARRWLDHVDFGVTGKYLYHRYTIGDEPGASSDPVFSNGTARGAFALDAGVSAAVAGPLRAGLAVRNINSPDVGLSSVDRVPREAQAGLSYDIEAWKLRLTADYVYRDVESGSLKERGIPSAGLEKSLAGDLVKFRIGATPDQFSGGVGFQLDRLGVDYAFVLNRNLISDNVGTHMIAIRYRFGASATASPGGD